MRKYLGKCYRKVLPVNVQARVDCARARRSWSGQEAIFIHVPKAAGISISTALYGKALGHIKAQDIRRFAPSDFYSFFKFSFVRHPVSRLISAMSYARQNYNVLQGGPGLPSLDELSLPPEKFIAQWLGAEPKNKVNFIFMEQSQFIFDNQDTLLVDYLARYESFDQEIAHLSDRVPALKKIERLNMSNSYDFPYSFDKTNAMLREVYPRDYELLGYE